MSTRGMLFMAVLAGALVGSASAGALSPALEGLLKSNPFSGGQSGSATLAEPPQPLELRGVLTEGHDYWFNLYNPTTKKGEWVRSGDKTAKYTVKDFDQDKEVLQLIYSGAPLQLALQSTRVLTDGAPPSAAVANLGTENPEGVMLDGGVIALPPTKITSLEQIASELNQRRLARVRAKVPSGTPASTGEHKGQAGKHK